MFQINDRFLCEAVWSEPENTNFITVQTQKLSPQRIMVKTILESDLSWPAIFSVIISSRKTSIVQQFLPETIQCPKISACSGFLPW